MVANTFYLIPNQFTIFVLTSFFLMPIKVDMKGYVVAKWCLTHLLKHAKHRIDDLSQDVVYGQTYKFVCVYQ